MYLVAIKSIFSKINRGRIVILDDGTLDSADKSTLKAHLSQPEIIHINDVDNSTCPKRGCWERLLLCIKFSQDNYVIQADSDLVAKSQLPEVVSAIDTNTAFTLGTDSGKEIVTFEQAAAFAETLPGDHIQLVAERAFARFADSSQLKYTRGSAGFAGFPKNGLSKAFVEDFSAKMEKIIAGRWSEWGTEQVTSNVVVSNSADAIVLPTSKYVNYFPPIDLSNVALIHFLGTHRFQGGDYRCESKRFIGAAMQATRAI